MSAAPISADSQLLRAECWHQQTTRSACWQQLCALSICTPRRSIRVEKQNTAIFSGCDDDRDGTTITVIFQLESNSTPPKSKQLGLGKKKKKSWLENTRHFIDLSIFFLFNSILQRLIWICRHWGEGGSGSNIIFFFFSSSFLLFIFLYILAACFPFFLARAARSQNDSSRRWLRWDMCEPARGGAQVKSFWRRKKTIRKKRKISRRLLKYR